MLLKNVTINYLMNFQSSFGIVIDLRVIGFGNIIQITTTIAEQTKRKNVFITIETINGFKILTDSTTKQKAL